MHEQLWLTALLNKHLAGVANAILRAVHVHPLNPQAPITNYIAMQLLTFALLIIFFIVVRTRLSVDNPGAMQHIVELYDSFVSTQSDEVIGHGYQRYIGFLSALGMYIIVNCLIGVI